ncbi:MAG: hypothetical protein HY319_14675 [Armatimonadetes bacterium]|nr:hypothetical protein [Armatimonadota bacterium]
MRGAGPGALSEARRLGPELAAWTGLEAAFLVEPGEDAARLALESAQCYEMGIPAGEARERLAVCYLRSTV